MNKKTVIGLNLDYFIKALVGSVIGFIAIFMPYARIGEKSYSAFALLRILARIQDPSKATFFLYGAVIFTVASLILAAFNSALTSVGASRLWQSVQAFATAFWTLLLFSSKAILEKAGIASSFLNKDLRMGYLISLVAAYFTLIMIMKMTKTNVGYIALTILGVIWMFPILWIVLTAFRAEQGYYVGYFIPHGFTFDNFLKLFSADAVLPFRRWWLNTLIVAAASCVCNTLIVLGTSFTLSRTRFTGRKAFMNVLMIIGMFPGFMSLIAVYNILKGLGLNQSLLALIIVGAAGAAMGYHVSKGFFDTIPKAIDEAAIIDGASRLQIFTHITLPLSKSIIVYTVLGAFLGAWSDYIFPSMLFGDKQSSYTVAVGLYWLTDFRRIDTYYTQFAAGAVIVAVPIVILFIWLQRFYVEGLSGSVKG